MEPLPLSLLDDDLHRPRWAALKVVEAITDRTGWRVVSRHRAGRMGLSKGDRQKQRVEASGAPDARRVKERIARLRRG